MNWKDWYTDLMDIYRVQAVPDGSLTRQERALAAEGVPCRIYQSKKAAIGMKQTAAESIETGKLACDLSADVRAGDELLIRRGGRLGKPGPTIRAFAGEPERYYEPFGAILPGLAHQEIALLRQERVG